MKKLELAVKITKILAFPAVAALVFLFLALADIADGHENLTMEWYVAGICLMILGIFTLSTIVMLVLQSKYMEVTDYSSSI